MKKFLISLLCASAMPTAFGSTTLELWGNAYRLDTLEHFYIGPGVVHSHLLLSSESRNLDVVVATLDKSDPSYNPVIKPRVEIGQDCAREVERVSEAAIRKSGGERQYIASINCDFFYMTDDDIPARGYPVNATIIDGKMATSLMRSDHLYGIIIGPDGMWIDDVNNFSYELRSADGSNSVYANSINKPERGGNELHIYNSYMQNSVTTSAEWDKDLPLVLAEGSKWAVNAPITFKVAEDWRSGAGVIPADGMVLTATKGYTNDWIESLKPGDDVTLEIKYALKSHGNIRPEITHFVAGDVHFLDNGTTQMNPPSRWYGDLYTQGENYPMSMAGFSEDQKKFVMVTVSRSGPNNSTGISYPEAADLMRYLGCYNAVNFDGGGSATMYAAPMGVVSHILYDVERPVANGLYLAMDSPVDNEVVSIRFADPFVNISQYATYEPIVYGYNRYGQLVDMDVKGFSVDASDNFDVLPSGIIADKAGTYALNISKDGMHASVAVNVEALIPSPRYPDLVLDPSHQAYPSLCAIIDGKYLPIADNAFDWTSSNPSVVDVDANTGLMTAISRGTATVTGHRGDTTVEVAVSVEIATEPLLPLDKDFGDSSWSIVPDGIENTELTATAEGWDINFDCSRKRGLSLTYAKDIVAYGLPERFKVDVNTHGSRISTFTVTIDAANDKGSFTLSPEIVVTNGGELIYELSKVIDVKDHSYYPLTFRSLNISPLSNADGTTHINFGLADMGFMYDNFEQSSVNDVAVGTTSGRLPLTVSDNIISTSVGVYSLKVYSPDGCLVATSTSNTITSPLSPGIYIVAGHTANGTLIAKIRI